MIGGVAIAAAGTFLKPSDMGAPYNPYFSQLNGELKTRGTYVPSMVVDIDIVDENIVALKEILNPKTDLRIVAKSLPSPELLAHIMEKAETNKLMVFHQPFLSNIADNFPTSDVLMGKPMPVKAAEKFYQLHDNDLPFKPSNQLQWLIDSKERLQQYLALAKSQNLAMQINIELDVGLHRGGLQQSAELDELLAIIHDNAKHLTFTGFMGYDPHVVKLPSIVKSADDAYQDSQAIYQSFIDKLYALAPDYKNKKLCLNGAGSPTIAMHKTNTIANELSAGSCLVKPIDFDIPSLAQFKPAAFIATPVLKKMAGTQIPAVEFAKDIFPLWDANMAQTFFIYGGKWLAKFESPQGLQDNGLFGSSTNQAIVNGSNKVNINVDDHVFLRPTQSEFVFLQFGSLLAVKNQKLIANWPILAQG